MTNNTEAAGAPPVSTENILQVAYRELTQTDDDANTLAARVQRFEKAVIEHRDAMTYLQRFAREADDQRFYLAAERGEIALRNTPTLRRAILAALCEQVQQARKALTEAADDVPEIVGSAEIE